MVSKIQSTKCDVCVYTPGCDMSRVTYVHVKCRSPGSPGRPHSMGAEVQLATPTLSPSCTRGLPRSPVQASLPPSDIRGHYHGSLMWSSPGKPPAQIIEARKGLVPR